MFVLCCVPCCVLCGVAKKGKCENPLIFVGRTTYTAFSRRGRSDQLVEGLGCKKSPENRCKKSSHGATEKVTKMIILKPKLVPKWTPEASGNVCGRRSAPRHGFNTGLRVKSAAPAAGRPPKRDFVSTAFVRRSFCLQINGARGPWGGLARAV